MKKGVKNTKGFTLVELIIVITILSILGTIGFVSFQGYTADARDTKRTSDLSSLISALESKRAGNSLSIVSFVDSATTAHVTGTFQLAGSGMTGTGTDYNAGTMNFSLLGVSAASFQDPRGFAYSFGATRLKGGQYQFAAVLEKGETPTAIVKGNYAPRTQSNISITPSSRNPKMLELKSTGDYSKLLVDDLLATQTAAANVCGVPAGTRITSVSSDLKFLTVTNNVTLNSGDTACNIQLGSNEVIGLIGDYSSATAATSASGVTNGSTTVLPY